MLFFNSITSSIAVFLREFQNMIHDSREHIIAKPIHYTYFSKNIEYFS